MADVSQIRLPNGDTFDLIDEKSGYITAQYIENKTDYSIPVSRVGEIVVGETAIGTDSTNFPTSKAVVDYVDERVVQEMDAIDVGVTGIKANGTSLAVENGVVNIPAIGPNQSVGLMTDQLMQQIWHGLNLIPTSTSQLTNDSGFITRDSDEKVKQEVVSSGTSDYLSILLAPAVNGTYTTTAYKDGSFTYQPSTGLFSVRQLRLQNSSQSGSTINTDFIGASTTDATITFPDASGTVALTSDIPTVPTNISSFTNDSGYLTSSDIASVLTYKGTKASYSALPSSGNSTGDVWHITDTGAEYAWDGSTWQELGTAIDLSGYATKATTLAGYGITDAKIQNGTITLGSNTITPLTSYTETDPTVPSWAKASSKPSYGLTEISGTDDLRAIEGLTGTSGLLKKTAANTWTLDTNTYLTSYTETDPIFSASAAASITSTDISNWNAKVSDDKTWNGVTLNKTYMSNKSSTIVPIFESGAAYYYIATATPTGGKVVLYDDNAYLNSTTPSANDNSTKVATTAYVDAAIPDTSGFVSKSGDTMSGNLILGVNNSQHQSRLQINYSDSKYITLMDNGADGNVGLLVLGNQTNAGVTTGNVRIRGVNSPVLDYDAANKQYVDAAIPKVYSSTNTGGYLTMATLPIYDGMVV